MGWNWKRLWLEAKGFPWWSHYEIADGRLPKKCYLCGREEDWLLGLRKTIPIYGKVTRRDFTDGTSVWIWNSTETRLADFAKDEQDCIREICAKPGCWFDNGIELNDVKTGELVAIPACPSRRVVKLLRDFAIGGVIHGYATMRFVGLSVRWVTGWTFAKLLMVWGNLGRRWE